MQRSCSGDVQLVPWRGPRWLVRSHILDKRIYRHGGVRGGNPPLHQQIRLHFLLGQQLVFDCLYMGVCVCVCVEQRIANGQFMWQERSVWWTSGAISGSEERGSPNPTGVRAFVGPTVFTLVTQGLSHRLSVRLPHLQGRGGWQCIVESSKLRGRNRNKREKQDLKEKQEEKEKQNEAEPFPALPRAT